MAQPPPPGGAFPLQPHLVFQSLKIKFEEAAQRFPDLKHYVVKLGGGLTVPTIVRHLEFADRHHRFGGDSGWFAVNGDEREVVCAVGSAEGLDSFDQLAAQAGAALPDSNSIERLLVPVCPFTVEPIVDFSPPGKWLLFVYNLLRQAGGMHFMMAQDRPQYPLPSRPLIESQRKGKEANAQPERSTFAFLTTDLFVSSVMAIDYAGLATPGGWDKLKSGPIEQPPDGNAGGTEPAKPATRRPTGPRPKNDMLLAFDVKVRKKNPQLTDKEVVELFKAKHPNHSIFDTDDPQGALRAARSRQRKRKGGT